MPRGLGSPSPLAATKQLLPAARRRETPAGPCLAGSQLERANRFCDNEGDGGEIVVSTPAKTNETIRGGFGMRFILFAALFVTGSFIYWYSVDWSRSCDGDIVA